MGAGDVRSARAFRCGCRLASARPACSDRLGDPRCRGGIRRGRGSSAVQGADPIKQYRAGLIDPGRVTSPRRHHGVADAPLHREADRPRKRDGPDRGQIVGDPLEPLPIGADAPRAKIGGRRGEGRRGRGRHGRRVSPGPATAASHRHPDGQCGRRRRDPGLSQGVEECSQHARRDSGPPPGVMTSVAEYVDVEQGEESSSQACRSEQCGEPRVGPNHDLARAPPRGVALVDREHRAPDREGRAGRGEAVQFLRQRPRAVRDRLAAVARQRPHPGIHPSPQQEPRWGAGVEDRLQESPRHLEGGHVTDQARCIDHEVAQRGAAGRRARDAVGTQPPGERTPVVEDQHAPATDGERGGGGAA